MEPPKNDALPLSCAFSGLVPLWNFLLCSIVCLWSKSTFVKVKNEFSNFAVDVPDVKGMMMWSVVQSQKKQFDSPTTQCITVCWVWGCVATERSECPF